MVEKRIWEELAESFRAGEAYGRLLEGPSWVTGLPVPAAAWVLGCLGHDLGRPLLVVLPREADALAWVEAAALFFGHQEALYLPAPSLTPYQEGDVSLKVRAAEGLALDRISRQAVGTVVATPRALLHRMPRPSGETFQVPVICTGSELDIGAQTEWLVTWGYRRVDLVQDVGDFAVRGGILDVFPPGGGQPARVDLFGQEVESIRRFDPDSQRSAEVLQEVRLVPLQPFRTGEEDAKLLAQVLKAALKDPGYETVQRVEALESGEGFPGWHRLLALTGESAGLWQWLPHAVSVVLDPDAVRAQASRHLGQLETEFAVREEQRRFAVPPELLTWALEDVESVLEEAWVRLDALTDPAGQVLDFKCGWTDELKGQLPRFPREVEGARDRGERLFVVSPAAHHDKLRELLEGREIEIGPGGAELLPGQLQRGFRFPLAGAVIYGEPQLVPRSRLPRLKARSAIGPFLSSLRDLKVGDYVVHMDHGIGQFVGLRTVAAEARPIGPEPLPVQEIPLGDTEVMEINYSDGRTLLLPLSRLDQVQKYSGIEGVAPRLDRLGGTSWAKTKARVKSSVRKMAQDLLKLYAQRQLAEAPAMEPDSEFGRQFEAAFPFEETPDQIQAIAEIRDSLERRRPMDRLLCGDVGFGKTEVAMRAALKVVESGYQVAVLAPTTILADQHLQTFRERFVNLPVEIDMVSRFRSRAEIREVTKKLEQGRVDILVGTHRLLSKDIQLPRLGLVVVDEEQRFGVAQKERLVELKKGVHVLSMSATPVPRTLQLSLAGVRDLSVIETPPQDRMAVETAILPFTDELVREAIEFEMGRGGQVYVVFNRVEGIESMAEWLQGLVPKVRVTIGHGQMDERELARRMRAFTRGEFDLLLATTIIENGIHIPRVNTMLVHRADRFGLAQLYQLRGRVGRSDQLAYCYLLVPEDRVVSEAARKRLAALREFSDLGAGFRIAARDLEIRGAGNLLGAEQSGHIAAVGIETYMRMLEETIKELKGERVRESYSATLDLPVARSIPSTYIPNPNLRMAVYQRISTEASSEENLLAELKDRFGPPPPEVRSLLQLVMVKRQAEELGVQSLSHEKGRLVIRLRHDTTVDVERLVSLIEDDPEARFSPSGVLSVPARAGDALLRQSRELLEAVAGE